MASSKIANRAYYCPTCGNREVHATNHTGEIYCECRACGNSPLYCAEVDVFEGRTYRTAVIHFYEYQTYAENYGNQKTRYSNLVQDLNTRGYHRFHAITSYRSYTAMKSHDGETVRLYDPDQFPADQYVSNIGRLHQWFEAAWDNRYIRSGYWLDILD